MLGSKTVTDSNSILKIFTSTPAQKERFSPKLSTQRNLGTDLNVTITFKTSGIHQKQAFKTQPAVPYDLFSNLG